MFLVHLVVEEDPALLLEHPPGREIEAGMMIETENETGTGTGIGTGIGTVIEKGTETKIGIGTKTHVVDETVTRTLIDISTKVAMMGLTREKRFPNPAEGALAVEAIAAAAAAAEVAGGTEAEIGITRRSGRAAGAPALSGSMRAVGESEVEAGAATGVRRQEDIGVGVATMTVIETGIVTVTVTATATATVTVTAIVIVIVIESVTVIVIEIESGTVTVTVTVRGIGIAEESQMSLQGLGAEVGSQEGSLLVGTRTPIKHCIMAHIGAIMERYHSWKVLITISTLYR
jgi:hypothetical protein